MRTVAILRSRTMRAVVVTAIALVGAVAVAAPAHAEDPPGTQGCPYEQEITTPSILVNPYHFGLGFVFKNGPGGHVSSTIEYNFTASATVSVSTGASANIVVAEANATFGVSGGVSVSLGQSWTYSHDISSNKYGNMQFGNWGWKVSVKKEIWNTACQYVVYNGSARIPSINIWGFRYWETSS